MNERLRRLIALARQRPPMTPEERWEQEIDFAWGNLAYDRPHITKEVVREAQRSRDSTQGTTRNPQ